METWLKFALVGLASALVCALIFLLALNRLEIGLLVYGVAFIAMGYILYRITSKNGTCEALWVTILSHVLINVVVFIASLFIPWGEGPHTPMALLFWVFLAGFMLFTLAFTAITCLTVWIIQIIKRKKKKGIIENEN